MKKSSYKLFVFLGIAIMALVVMYYVSAPPPPGGVDLDKPGPVKDFRVLCDSMKSSNWDAAKYIDLKGQLAALQSQGVVGSMDAMALGDYLELAYVQVLQKTCMAWKASDGSSADANLLKAMEEISSNPNCKSFVTDEIDAMRCYFSALGMPARVGSFMQQQFNSATCDRLIGELNKYCKKPGISHFNRLSGIYSKQQGELNNFKIFAGTYEGRKNFFNSYGDDPDAIENLQELCPDANQSINKYQFYLRDIKTIPGICN